MNILQAASGASEPLAHAIELINRDLDGLIDRLDTHRQNEFWTELRQYALMQTQNPEKRGNLIVADHVNAAVRESLQMADEKLTTHLRDLPDGDRARVWQVLHDAAEEQIRQTKHPKARHGGGGQSA